MTKELRTVRKKDSKMLLQTLLFFSIIVGLANTVFQTLVYTKHGKTLKNLAKTINLKYEL